ncbi:hypothetical protein G6F49_002767 [Rhizopus delemar]|nr:hypothetical protein G6F49_002767 [Rhizopus delemar]KAG1591990.1 hypothetical protein G6F48_002939 [Rhizopus delemar]KAG1644692.1 hypothetical protein G6F44_002583 [Rhizopus delemar]
MAFKFNFTSEDLDLEETEENQQLESSLHDLSLEENNAETPKIPSKEYDITSSPLPQVIQADRLLINNVPYPIYKRTLADVRFQLAQQDNFVDNDTDKEVISMLSLSGNSDLIKGVYEGGFKTWECSIDMVEYLSSLPKDETSNKKILELGCGSSIPSLYLLSCNESNKVDIQDYNEQVIRYVSIPNILLNSVLNVQEPAVTNEEEPQLDTSSESEEEEEEEEGEEDEKRIEEDPVTCDAEAEIATEQIPTMLQQVNARTRAFFGDWSTLPERLGNDQGQYDMIVTSETIYAEHSFSDLTRVFQKALKKPDGVCYIGAKTVYFGVGGGILPFCNFLKKSVDEQGHKLKYEKVFESARPIKGEILKVTWDL